MIYLNGTFKASVSRGSKVFQTLLAVPDFSKVAVAEVSVKQVFLKILQTTGVFL